MLTNPMFRPVIHLLLHLIVPAVVARVFFRENFLKAWLTMLATMLVDLDHLIADPIYDAGRCSIGFHPLHQYPVIAAYTALALWPKLRLLGIGLIIHMALDGVDCIWITYEE
jgi:hypothetical protein